MIWSININKKVEDLYEKNSYNNAPSDMSFNFYYSI